MPEVTMYMSEHCPYCVRARRLLHRKGVRASEISVDEDDDQRQLMMQRSRRSTVPQIFIGDIHVGGYDDLARLDFEGELDPLLGL